MRKPTPEEITEATQPIVNDMGLSIEEACEIFHGGFCCREDCSNCTEQCDKWKKFHKKQLLAKKLARSITK